MLNSSGSKWRFWLLWVLASTLAGSVIEAVVRAAAHIVGNVVGGAGREAAGEALGAVVGEAALGFSAAGGVTGAIGTAQWFVLRRQVSWAGWWVLANVVGGAVGGAVTLGVWAALGIGETLAALAGVILGMAVVFGTTQWLVLRRQVPWAGWLASASVVGWVAAGPLGAGVLGHLLGSGGGFGLVYGAITGGVFVFFLSRRAIQ